MSMCVCAHLYACMCVCVFVRMYVRVCVFVYGVCMCVYICMGNRDTYG